jgi:hypothetical protein
MSEIVPDRVFGKHWKPILLKVCLFSVIWVVFWYATTVLFYKDVEATYHFLGFFALPIAVLIIFSADYISAKMHLTPFSRWIIFSLTTTLSLFAKPVWLFLVYVTYRYMFI